ncbi:hypothetical protein IE53DRAFT_389619 [Violaceomyces palustris]|uniref:Uncharacterized protein n=1 Tax=Violaceomyces palustris TaxID=1673888 RepID=A0ACD0NQU1_9BASI|nr:hypothetical protein IE53DRAFT_389619 [Violaceomyces palustris]
MAVGGKERRRSNEVKWKGIGRGNQESKKEKLVKASTELHQPPDSLLAFFSFHVLTTVSWCLMSLPGGLPLSPFRKMGKGKKEAFLPSSSLRRPVQESTSFETPFSFLSPSLSSLCGSNLVQAARVCLLA